ncbi:uncharacterized protein Tco025E_07849 [Trypanosoma conorhini]|uniref:CFA20 domain-containing protein n=1 Tax=Trypanosoma conorhini TaxID=83891 RepID=A0A3R7MN37_9TRYP|nr:uncharacterized protein Tco025E_07849 [Trypanosoma conorhini]RNF05503.1 hypothetical protein Tco025E_07849 [Trypanosoma conorhini]
MTGHTILQDVLVPRDPGCLSATRIQNESCCAIKHDRTLHATVLVLKGGLAHARVEIPCEDHQFLSSKFPQLLIILQACLGCFDSFALEVAMHISSSLRVELTIGTQFNKATVEDVNSGVVIAKMPLIIPRNRWVQVVFHVSGILTHLLNLSPIQSLDSIALSGSCKTSRLTVCNDEDEAINMTPGDMALFAVPAYAPPIWQTAALTAAPVALSAGRTQSGSNSAMNATGTRLPVVGETAMEWLRTPFLRQDGTAKCNMQPSPPSLPAEDPSPKLGIVSASQPPSPCETPQEKLGSPTKHGLIGASTPTFSKQPPPPPTPPPPPPPPPRQQQQQQHAPSPSRPLQQQKEQKQVEPSLRNGNGSYIRLVNPTNRPQQRNNNAFSRIRSNTLSTKDSAANGPLTPASGTTANLAAPSCSSNADAWCGITGWEESVDPLGGVNAVSSSGVEFTGKCSSQSNQGSAGERGAAGVNNRPSKSLDSQRSKSRQPKKMPEVRKRPAFVSIRRQRRGGDGGTDSQGVVDSEMGNSTTRPARRRGIALRQSRLRERIKLLKEAQVSARRIHEMKKLPASELPIDPMEEAQMMVGDEVVDVMKEPRCGYGFGYLGVLREGGGFEADEGADTKLKGALTLALSELSEDEEERE